MGAAFFVQTLSHHVENEESDAGNEAQGQQFLVFGGGAVKPSVQRNMVGFLK